MSDHTGCQRPLGSSNVNDFYFIWQGIWHLLLVINSNFGRISHRFRDMVSFPLKTHILSTSLRLIKSKTVPFALDRWNFACLGFWHRANYSCKKFFFPYDLPFSPMHALQTTTDDNRTTYVRPLLKYGRPKRRCRCAYSLSWWRWSWRW